MQTPAFINTIFGDKSRNEMSVEESTCRRGDSFHAPRNSHTGWPCPDDMSAFTKEHNGALQNYSKEMESVPRCCGRSMLCCVKRSSGEQTEVAPGQLQGDV